MVTATEFGREEWRAIDFAPGYEVSNQGRVRSTRPWRGSKGRILAAQPNGFGYLRAKLYIDGKAKHCSIHRLILLAFVGPCPDGHEVRHLDGNRSHNTLANLAYGTRSENVRDAIEHGTHGPSSKTHCPQGHPYDEANTYVFRGGRSCRVCMRIRNRRHYYKARGLPSPYDVNESERAS